MQQQPADARPFVPDDFVVPVRHRHEPFLLEPLGPRHNEADHVAWSTSIDHIRSTPGFSPEDWDGDPWPFPMSLDDNLGDLCDHVEEFARREAFAYTVVDAAAHDAGTLDVIGCVYVDPDVTGAADAKVRCWVRSDRADLDADLVTVVREWLAAAWPFATARFPGR